MVVSQQLINSRIENSFKNKNSFIASIITKAENYQQLTLSTLKYLTGRNIPGIYVTINKPYFYIKKQLSNENIPTKKIIFIDVISKFSGAKVERDENCFYIETPENLTDLGIAITEASNSLSIKNKFLFFDSLSILSSYHKDEILIKFSHFLVTKMRGWEMQGVLMSLTKQKEIINQISQFLDMVIDFSEAK